MFNGVSAVAESAMGESSLMSGEQLEKSRPTRRHRATGMERLLGATPNKGG